MCQWFCTCEDSELECLHCQYPYCQACLHTPNGKMRSIIQCFNCGRKPRTLPNRQRADWYIEDPVKYRKQQREKAEKARLDAIRNPVPPVLDIKQREANETYINQFRPHLHENNNIKKYPPTSSINKKPVVNHRLQLNDTAEPLNISATDRNKLYDRFTNDLSETLDKDEEEVYLSRRQGNNLRSIPINESEDMVKMNAFGRPRFERKSNNNILYDSSDSNDDNNWSSQLSNKPPERHMLDDILIDSKENYDCSSLNLFSSRQRPPSLDSSDSDRTASPLPGMHNSGSSTEHEIDSVVEIESGSGSDICNDDEIGVKASRRRRYVPKRQENGRSVTEKQKQIQDQEKNKGKKELASSNSESLLKFERTRSVVKRERSPLPGALSHKKSEHHSRSRNYTRGDNRVQETENSRSRSESRESLSCSHSTLNSLISDHPNVYGSENGSSSSVFDRLTDSKSYTGTHKHRFDSEGHGRGLAGRDSVAKGVGHVPSPEKQYFVVSDTLRKSDHSTLRSSSTPVLKFTNEEAEHVWRHSLNSNKCHSGLSKKKNSASEHLVETAPELAKSRIADTYISSDDDHDAEELYVRRLDKRTRRQAAEKNMRAGGAVYGRLTDVNAYTGSHKRRFDLSSGKGRGRAGRYDSD